MLALSETEMKGKETEYGSMSKGGYVNSGRATERVASW